MRLVWVRAALLAAGCFALAACAGGGNPLPQPTTTPGQPSGADYFPLNNASQWEVAMPPGSLGFDIWYGSLAIRSSDGSSCDSVAGLSGDYFANAELLVPDVEETSPQVIGPPLFVYNNIVVTKDLSNDLLVDGYVNPGSTLVPGAVTCVTPYALMKSNAKAGDTWSYTDIVGRKITASVVFDHRAETYTANKAPQSYSSVTEVNYGTDFTIDWALGYGPVQIVEHNAGADEPLSYTAFDYSVSL